MSTHAVHGQHDTAKTPFSKHENRAEHDLIFYLLRFNRWRQSYYGDPLLTGVNASLSCCKQFTGNVSSRLEHHVYFIFLAP